MLILQRYPGQSILIGENIHIKILRSCNGNIHIGIKAPTEIRILREELYPYITEPSHDCHFTKIHSA
jgi:carbon storage regulator